jgi:hypothetical protein
MRGRKRERRWKMMRIATGLVVLALVGGCNGSDAGEALEDGSTSHDGSGMDATTPDAGGGDAAEDGGAHGDAVAAKPCTGDEECNDGVGCTLDECVGGWCVNAPQHQVCDDGNACNGLETCSPAVGCQAGVALDCDDGDACTLAFCDSEMGCTYPPRSCDDGNPCTENACDRETGCTAVFVGCPDAAVDAGGQGDGSVDAGPCVTDPECDGDDPCRCGRLLPGGACTWEPLPNCTVCPGGYCDIGFCLPFDCDDLSDDCNVGECNPDPIAICHPVPKPDCTPCAAGEGVCSAGTCITEECPPTCLPDGCPGG